MTRIVIIGNGGSGKSTLAQELSRRWNLKHVEIDSLAFEPDYNRVPIDTVNARLSREVEFDDWVVEGMHRLELSRWAIPRAQLLIWLDMPKHLIIRRLLARTIRRAFAGANLHRELTFVIKTVRAHEGRRGHHRVLLDFAKSTGVETFHLRSEDELEEWLRATS